MIGNLNRRLLQTESAWMREELSRYQPRQPCETCHGARLKPEALGGQDRRRGHLHVHPPLGRRRARLVRQPRGQAHRPAAARSPSAILKEIDERLGFLNNVGLDYLNLDRTSGTLSGGESQRIRLASQIGSGLSGVLYVLDEPSIGLHQRDNDRLLETLKRLRDLGNTVIVVEHDEDAIRPADHVIDMGPGAGVHGGEIVAQGTLAGTARRARAASPPITSPAAARSRCPAKRRKGNGKKRHRPRRPRQQPARRHRRHPARHLHLHHRRLGLGQVERCTIDTLYAAAARALNGARIIAGPHDKITGLEHLDKVIDIDQSPIGRTPRSNPATYTGAFTQIRDWFAGLPESQARGYKPGRFSFNVKGGRCEACQGDGLIKIEMHFLPDVYVTCDVCHGRRYNRETLEVKFKGRSIADVLDMTVEDAAEFFKAVPPIRDKMRMLDEVGLGYVKVGQQATTLSAAARRSASSSPRNSSAAPPARRSTSSTSRPPACISRTCASCSKCSSALVDQGNTVVVIEHNLDVIKTADWVIDLGPEGGVQGRRDRRRGHAGDGRGRSRRLPGSIWRRCWSGRPSSPSLPTRRPSRANARARSKPTSPTSCQRNDGRSAIIADRCGGMIVAGMPGCMPQSDHETVAACAALFTGQYLKPLLERQTPSPLEERAGVSALKVPGEGRGPGPKIKTQASALRTDLPDLIPAK